MGRGILLEIKQQLLDLRKQLIARDFARMNSEQQRAVFAVEGPVLILAGAGSGKTTVLINRVGNLIQYGNAYHSERLPFDVTASDVQLLQKALSGQTVDPIRLKQLTSVDAPRP